MSKGEIIVEVQTKLTVDRETAETCLKLVEMYVNQNPVDIIARKEETGEVKFAFEEQQSETRDIKAFPLYF